MELLTVVVILGLLIWFMGERQTRVVTEGGRLLPGVAPERTLRLTVERGTTEIECEKSPDGWHIVRPLKSRANKAEIDRILVELESLQRIEAITASERKKRDLSLDDYQLGKSPRARLVFADERGITTLLVGRESPLDGRVYVRFGESTDVIATGTNILSALPTSVDTLRDTLVVRGNPARIVRVEIERAGGGYVEMIRRMGRWVMLQPAKNARLNAKKVEGLLDTLCGIRARAFLSEREAVRCGLTEATAALKIGFWEEGGGSGRTLLLGQQDAVGTNSVFARLADGDLVCVVDPGIESAFSVAPSDLRERQVFCISAPEIAGIRLRDGEDKVEFRGREDGEWRITEPRKWKADSTTMSGLLSAIISLQAVDFAEGSETNLVQLGLAEVRRSIEIGRYVAKPEGDAATADAGLTWDRLIIGLEDKQTGKTAVKLEDDASIMLLGTNSLLKAILGGTLPGTGFENAVTEEGNGPSTPAGGQVRRWLSPTLYYDRQVLVIAPEEIRSIVLTKDGRQQTVRRDDNGEWNMPVMSAAGSVATQVVDSVVSAMSNLRARRVEWQQGAAPASYGLDTPAAELTVGLSGENGIRKTLAIGFRAGTDGVYATIRGQDAVFVLSRDLVDILVRDLIVGAQNNRD